MFSAKAKVCGIIAKPVKHSMSPILHKSLAKYYKLDFAYVPFLVEEDLKKAIEGAYHLGIHGLNISLPYKQEIMNYLSYVDSSAKIIGAVNTLLRDEKNKKFIGTNTDYLGLDKALLEANIEIENKKIIILGCGGVAKASIYLCLERKVKSINLFNRNKEKAKKIVKDLLVSYANDKEFFYEEKEDEFILSKDEQKINFRINSFIELENNIEKILSYKDYIAFQTTNVGMYPNNEEIIFADSRFYDKCLVGIDLIYTPKITSFMKEFIKRNKKNINGLDMLINQGISSFEYWNNIKVDDIAKNIAKKEIEKILDVEGEK